MVHSFEKMLFIGQNLKHVHMAYSLVELLIFWPKKYCMWIQTSWETNHQSWNTNHQLVSNIDVEKTCFFKCKCFYLVFLLSRAFTIQRTAGERVGYLFNSSLPLPPIHRHLDISRTTTAESSPLHISSRTQTRNFRFSSASC